MLSTSWVVAWGASTPATRQNTTERSWELIPSNEAVPEELQWVPGEEERLRREADHSPPSSAEVRMRGAIPPHPHTSSWRGSWLHRGKTLPLPLALHWNQLSVSYEGYLCTGTSKCTKLFNFLKTPPNGKARKPHIFNGGYILGGHFAVRNLFTAFIFIIRSKTKKLLWQRESV
jgi:hypothetical protein